MRFGALLWEPFGADELGVREGGFPLAEEDVVLKVGGDDVFEVVAEGSEFGLNVVGEGNG